MSSPPPKKQPQWTVEFADALVLQDAEKRITAHYPSENDRKHLLAEMRTDLAETMPRTPETVLDWPPQANDVPGISNSLRRRGRRLSYLAKIDARRHTIQIYRIVVA